MTAGLEGACCSLGATVHLRSLSKSGLTSLQRWLYYHHILKQLSAHSLPSSLQLEWVITFIHAAPRGTSRLTDQPYRGLFVRQTFQVKQGTPRALRPLRLSLPGLLTWPSTWDNMSIMLGLKLPKRGCWGFLWRNPRFLVGSDGSALFHPPRCTCDFSPLSLLVLFHHVRCG